jgi:cytochrome c oxidase cbb3-type subunit 3
MGPPLMDDKWRYGGSTQEIVATILDGRPNGMPSYRNRITEDEAWQLASYVRSMSARTREDILVGRADEPSSVEPPTLEERKPVRHVTPDQDNASPE